MKKKKNNVPQKITIDYLLKISVHGFAELFMEYLEGKVILPISAPCSNILWAYETFAKHSKNNEYDIYKNQILDALYNLRKTYSLKSVEELPLDDILKFRIYLILTNLGFLIYQSNHFIELNRKYNSIRKEAIEHLEKFSEKSLHNLYLPLVCSKQRIEVAIEVLRDYDKQKIQYHPILENYWVNLFIKWKAHQDVTALKEQIRMVLSPLIVKEGRPVKFFQNALKMILLNFLGKHYTQIQNEINPSAKYKKITANIINDFSNKHDIPGLEKVKLKDIDNAIQSNLKIN